MKLGEIMSRLTTAACGAEFERQRSLMVRGVMNLEERDRSMAECPDVTEEILAPMEEWVRGRPDRLRGLMAHILLGVPLDELAEGVIDVRRRLATKAMMN